MIPAEPFIEQDHSSRSDTPAMIITGVLEKFSTPVIIIAGVSELARNFWQIPWRVPGGLCGAGRFGTKPRLS
jgi:hypothetical protein